MRKILCVLAVVFGVVGLAASPAAAKSYSIDSMSVEATLKPDASMDVTEHLTYSFSGEFHNGTRPIPGGDYQIVNMKVMENGQPLPSDGEPNNLAWHFIAVDQTRTFDISYTVLNAAKVASDVGELYWKFMGNDHPAIGTVEVNVTTPSADQLRAWGHGPLSGVVAINGNSVNLRVSPLPANTFLEGRLTLRSSAFTVAPSGENRLPGILAEEKVNADDANAERGFTPVPERQYPSTLLNILGGIAAVALIGAHVAIWRRWGREPSRPQDIGKYWYDAQSVAPATVVATLGNGDGFAGTLVDLAQRGYLTIEEVKDDSGMLSKIFGAKHDWVFTQQKVEQGELQPFERRMLQYLFEEGASVSQSSLHDRAKKHQSEAREFLSSFDAEVKESVDGMYWVTGTWKAKSLNLVLAVAGGLFGFVCVANKAYIGAVLLFVVALVVAVLTKNMSRRTDLGARKAAEWNGLRTYLKDFSNFKDAPIGHMVLWERYLVYGVALGVASELAKGFEMHMPEDERNSASFAPWYVGTGGINDFGRIAAISTFSSGLTSAMSPPSSSSGSGGGFSGGGGGGGGGGGAGAS